MQLLFDDVACEYNDKSSPARCVRGTGAAFGQGYGRSRNIPDHYADLFIGEEFVLADNGMVPGVPHIDF